MEIPFTQYLRPSGRQRQVSIDLEDLAAQAAQKLLDAGYHFDIEVLSTGQVSAAIEDGDDLPLAHVVVENGPGLVPALEGMFKTASGALVRGA